MSQGDIFTLLEILPCNDSKTCQVKEEIVQYLKGQGFPEKDAYK